MKIEKLNPDQIQCTLTGQDLKERNLVATDLYTNSENFRNMVIELISSAKDDIDFDIQGSPLMIETTATSEGCIIFTITRITKPEDVMNLVSRAMKDLGSYLAHTAPNDIFFDEPYDEEDGNVIDLPVVQPFITSIYSFVDLDTISEMAKSLSYREFGGSNLFRDPEDGTYYLSLENINVSDEDFLKFCMKIGEYGTPVYIKSTADAYFKEHFETIVLGNALEIMEKL